MISDHDLNSQGLSTRLNHCNGLRMTIGGYEEPLTFRTVGDSMTKVHRFGCRGCFVE